MIYYVNLTITVVYVCGSQWLAMALDYIIILWFVQLQVLLNSKLPIDVLGRVWELADIDKDGMLDNDEFAVVRMKEATVTDMLKYYT